ncbi:MAG: PAS domain S-box protein [Proteobacteria bacterium]|nr:PAS domain S-box protein [Pseudomonadota bacterium]
MSPSQPACNRRVLVVDDDPQVHLLIGNALTMDGGRPAASPLCDNPFEVTVASHGSEAEALTRAAEEAHRPFALGFVDMYLPDMDGCETLARLWHCSPEMQIVLCTSAADTSLGKLIGRFGYTDQLIVLKKPFHGLELVQLANAMTAKWQGFVALQDHLAQLESVVFARTEEARRAVTALKRELDERRKSEEQLRRNEELLRLITDNAADLIAVVDGQGRRVYNSPSYQRVLGYRPADLQASHSLEQIHPEDRQQVSAAAQLITTEGRDNHLEYRMRHRDGTWRHLESSGSAIRNVQGEVEKVVIVARDITTRKQAEAVATESGQRLRSLISNIPGAVYRCTPPPERQLEFISDLIWELSGYPCTEFTEARTQSFTSIIHPEDYAAVQDAVQMGISRRLPYVADYRLVRADGSIRWVHDKGQADFDEHGSVRWLDGVIFDITERKQQEEEMRRLHTETENLFASISAILVGVDVTGRVARWNAAAATALGLAASEVMGQPFHTLPIEWDWLALQRMTDEALRSNHRLDLDNFTLRNKDGAEVILSVTITPSKPDAENRLNFILLAVDVTHRHTLESQLRDAQKLESIGRLAAGIAHEINTPTQYIGDNLRFLRDAFTDLAPVLAAGAQLGETVRQGADPQAAAVKLEKCIETADLAYLRDEIPRAVEEAVSGVDRVTKIVQAMKEFSHPGNEEKTPIDINRAIQSTITVARNEWKYVADLVTDFDGTLPPVPCQPGSFNQAVLNIIVNAAHAIAGKGDASTAARGTITVTTRRAGDWAELRVQDTGTGIPEPARAKIFDPFFTTKEVGKGTGQGLAIARSVVVDKHAGSIHFETETGRGTTFVIRLPLQTATPN